MKVAIIFDGNLVDIKGKVNAIINRIHHLQQIADYQIDVFTIQQFYSGIEKKIWGEYISEKPKFITIDDVRMKILWYKCLAIDNFLSHRLHKKTLYQGYYIKSIVPQFADYDLLSVHSFLCGTLALQVKEKYNIPYFITWHGSEIHSIPHGNKYQIETTQRILQNARSNFFVSKSLYNDALKIEDNIKYDILYNGCGKEFVRFDDEKRYSLRNKFNVANSKVVAFVGNLKQVKNPDLLPMIFERVRALFKGNVSFWIVGDGPMKSCVEDLSQQKKLNVNFWGNQPRDVMPDIMNCIDVLVLPSRNESFGLVCAEAISCGANAVGSRVGGILEVLGEENTFELNETFVDEISNKVAYYLTSIISQQTNIEVSWDNTARKENEIYCKQLNIHNGKF